jgi:hypothetical protein
MDALMLESRSIYDYDYKLKAFELCHKLLGIKESINLNLFLFSQENQIPYD